MRLDVLRVLKSIPLFSSISALFITIISISIILTIELFDSEMAYVPTIVLLICTLMWYLLIVLILKISFYLKPKS